MKEVIRLCIEPLLPWYRDLKRWAPSWCGALGLLPPRLTRFSAQWSMEEVMNVNRGAAGPNGWRLTFSPRQVVGVLVTQSGQVVALPSSWQAFLISSALLAQDDIPTSLDAVRFDPVNPQLGQDLSWVKDDIAAKIGSAIEPREYFEAHTAGRAELESCLRKACENAGVLPLPRSGLPGPGLDNATLRCLYTECTTLVNEVVTCLKNDDPEHTSTVRRLLDAPLPSGWEDGAPEWEKNLAWGRRRVRHRIARTAVGSANLMATALRLRFPMLGLGECRTLLNSGKTGAKRPPVKRLALELTAGRLGVSYRSLERYVKQNHH